MRVGIDHAPCRVFHGCVAPGPAAFHLMHVVYPGTHAYVCHLVLYQRWPQPLDRHDLDYALRVCARVLEGDGASQRVADDGEGAVAEIGDQGSGVKEELRT